MTNELEKQFFDTFGIEPYDRYLSCTENLEVDCNRNCNCCDKAEDVYCYPQISDSILLELICILNTRPVYASNAHGTNVYDLKNYVLKRCIYEVDNIKHQVRTLFKEG